MNTRALFALTTSAFTIVGLAACGPDDESTQGAAVPASSAPSSSDVEFDSFFNLLDRAGVDYGTDKEKAFAVGESTCTLYKDGVGLLAIGTEVSQSLRISYEDAGGVMGAGIFTFCPEEYSSVERDLAVYGN